MDNDAWCVIRASRFSFVGRYGLRIRSFSMKNRSIGSEPVFVKSFTYEGMPEGGRSEFTRDFQAFITE